MVPAADCVVASDFVAVSRSPDAWETAELISAWLLEMEMAPLLADAVEPDTIQAFAIAHKTH